MTALIESNGTARRAPKPSNDPVAQALMILMELPTPAAVNRILNAAESVASEHGMPIDGVCGIVAQLAYVADLKRREQEAKALMRR